MPTPAPPPAASDAGATRAALSVPPATAAAPTLLASAGIGREYHLSAGDKVRVLVYGEPTLSGEFVVDGFGEVALPLVGGLRAAGASTKALEAAFAEALRGRFIKNPRVSVEVLNFRPFYVLGEVSSPGSYPYVEGLTVYNAVATAKGFTYRANRRSVRIRRAGSDREERVTLTPSTAVLPGDTLFIDERVF